MQLDIGGELARSVLTRSLHREEELARREEELARSRYREGELTSLTPGLPSLKYEQPYSHKVSASKG